MLSMFVYSCPVMKIKVERHIRKTKDMNIDRISTDLILSLPFFIMKVKHPSNQAILASSIHPGREQSISKADLSKSNKSFHK